MMSLFYQTLHLKLNRDEASEYLQKSTPRWAHRVDLLNPDPSASRRLRARLDVQCTTRFDRTRFSLLSSVSCSSQSCSSEKMTVNFVSYTQVITVHNNTN
jgi:hypothetical protein